MKYRSLLAFVFGVLILPALWWGGDTTYAQEGEIERLQSEIRTSNNRLAEIEKEIAQFELALLEVGAEKNTLQKAINQLELERKKVQADISFTEQKINATDMELNKLILEIRNTERDIATNQTAVAETIRSLNQQETESLVSILLSYDHLSEFWTNLEALETVRNSMSGRVENLQSLQATLEAKRDQTTGYRKELVQLKDQYVNQNSVLTNNRAEQAELLSATRNEEAEYQSLLQQKQTARDQIVSQMRQFESQLQFILDPNTIPSPGTRVFDWPLANIRVTQYFGGTEFAKRNPGIYAGRAYHPGVDFGAPRGTPIFAPLAGTVRATGNTDAFAGCYSWGKWTLIDHANGLSTLYAHQDVLGVQPGQRVTTGEVIGYVGSTGFSTGPHLHFTVYVKDGVTIRKFNEIKSVTSCGAATTPVAATEAYIDPMLYLPAS